MAISKKKKQRYYTVDEANAMLPLLRSILRDVTVLARHLAMRHDRLSQLQQQEQLARHERQELQQIEDELEGEHARMRDFLHELESLGVELKDPFVGLVDWRAVMNDHEVYLCWKLDEPEVCHWHELDAGFAGRQRLMVGAVDRN